MTGASSAITFATAGVLLALSFLHLYWAGGGSLGSRVVVPERDGTPLFRPGTAATLVVAGLLLMGAALLFAAGGVRSLAFLPPGLVRAGTGVLALVFLARAIGDFRWMGFTKRVRGTAFARWDTRLFSPLCVLIGCGCVVATWP